MSQVPGDTDGSPYLVFGQPVLSDETIAEVVDTLRSGWIGPGPKVERFEELFAQYLGVDHAVAVSSCTAALHLCLLAVAVGPGDEVITTPLTFPATSNTVTYTGATPVFVDVDPATRNIDPEAVGTAINERTRAVVPVHLAGLPCRMAELTAISDAAGVHLIEDAAHAVGGRVGDSAVGSVSTMTAFSFYPTKNITTVEGGLVTTHRSDLAARVRLQRQHGMGQTAWDRFGEKRSVAPALTVMPGFKYTMSDVQASVGIHQIGAIDSWRDRRSEIWSAYDDCLADLPVELPPRALAGDTHARHLYSVLVSGDSPIDRDELRQHLHDHGIGTGIHYRPVHLHPWYVETFGFRRGMFPVAERIGETTLSLPLSPFLTDADVDRVVTAVRSAFDQPGPGQLGRGGHR